MTTSVHGPARRRSGPSRTEATQRFLVTFVVLFALIAFLLALDFFLARIDRNETRTHAANLFRDGQALLAAGKSSDAADELALAVALDRNNVAYGLALAQAMIADKRTGDAETLLGQLLSRAPNNGPLNLTMAQLLVATTKSDDARAFYHRAIYGKWGNDSTERRMKARLELISLLSRQGAREELLAELLPLQGMSGDSTMLLRTVAPLYVRAGSPARAAAIYSELLHREPKDLSAYLGLSDADLALGEFRTAKSDLLKASREFPGDTAIDRRLSRLDSAFALDPDARGLTDSERLRRSSVLLEQTVLLLDGCGIATSPSRAALLDSARASMSLPVGASSESILEHRLALFASLRQAIARSCPSTLGGGVLDLVEQLIKS